MAAAEAVATEAPAGVELGLSPEWEVPWMGARILGFGVVGSRAKHFSFRLVLSLVCAVGIILAVWMVRA